MSPALWSDLPPISRDRPVLIAGPTASGKSDLALWIAETSGGVIVNADASQVYDCWRILTARPSLADETRAPHLLYGHVPWQSSYSTGHWLREVKPLLQHGERPIITGGTGLYFHNLTNGMADIPPTPAAIRKKADEIPLAALIEGLDPETARRLDLANRARVQRAWEVLQSTGRGLADWQAETGPPLLALQDCTPIVLSPPKEWLIERIETRFGQMIAAGALAEVDRMLPHWDDTLPAFRAIGAPELAAHLRGDCSLDDARNAATIATRQFAGRQRKWFRRKMAKWQKIAPRF